MTVVTKKNRSKLHIARRTFVSALIIVLSLALPFVFQARTLRPSLLEVKSSEIFDSLKASSKISEETSILLQGMLGSNLPFAMHQQPPPPPIPPQQSHDADDSAKALHVHFNPEEDSLVTRTGSINGSSGQDHTDHFCVPWDVDSDDWWMHHPEWKVAAESENSTHTCYRRRSAKSTEFLQKLYRIQFSHEYHDPPLRLSLDPATAVEAALSMDRNRSNCTIRRMWSDGFASDVRNVLDGLVEAYQSSVGFTYDATPWHYVTLQDGSHEPPDPYCTTAARHPGAPPDRTMSCYFLDLSDCPGRHAVLSSTPKRDDGLEGGDGGNYYGHRPPSFVKSKLLLQYALRPRQWIRKRVYHHRQSIQNQLFRAMRAARDASTAATSFGTAVTTSESTSLGTSAAKRSLIVEDGGCTVVHVRRGDVALGNSRSTSRRKYRPLSDYLRHVRTRTVMLLTDDANVLENEAPKFSNFTFVSWNRTRYRGEEGGWEEHLPSRDPVLEMTVLVATLELVRSCRALVHTASNFGQLLYAQMHPNVRRVNLDSLPRWHLV